MTLSTVSAVLTRIGLGKRSRLEPPEPPNRYELARPGQLVHVDVKKLGRITGAGHRMTGQRQSQAANRRRTGWEFVHVCVDDATRLAYAEVFQGKGENARQAVAFLKRGLAFFQVHGVEVERVMSDNGSAIARRSTRSPAARLGSATCASGPGGRAPMARSVA
jgi:hypothetical protein